MGRTLVFDVNETLLDLAALDEPFAAVFGDSSVRRLWFAQVLQSALVCNALGVYRDFGVVASAALDMVAQRRETALDDADRTAILSTMRRLPPHPEVPAALDRLKAAGHRLAALTNSPTAVMTAQLQHAGLADQFDLALSVDEVQTFKPHRAVYDMAAARLREDPGSLMLIAAHEWDTTGAMHAGWQAAFVARPGMVLGPLSSAPTLVGDDLQQIAQQLTTDTTDGGAA